MMSNIVYFPKIDLDYDRLKKIATQSKPISGRPNHHRLVEEDEYMLSIRQKYDFLSPIYNLYKLPNGLPVHVDAGRKCTLNIPLFNTDNSQTIVYEHSDEKTNLIEDRVFHQFNNSTGLVEIYRFTLNRPTLFNTTWPHEVRSNGQMRISISWSLLSHISFEEAVELFNAYALN